MARRLDCGFRLSPWIEVHLLKSLSENGAELETTFDKPTTQDLLRIQFYELIRFFFALLKQIIFGMLTIFGAPRLSCGITQRMRHRRRMSHCYVSRMFFDSHNSVSLQT